MVSFSFNCTCIPLSRIFFSYRCGHKFVILKIQNVERLWQNLLGKGNKEKKLNECSPDLALAGIYLLTQITFRNSYGSAFPKSPEKREVGELAGLKF